MTIVDESAVKVAAGESANAVPTTIKDPVSQAVHLRPPQRRGMEERFADSDPHPGWDLTRFPRVGKLVRNRRFQFLLILPNQMVFWLVIVLGLAGTVVPGLNFGTAITWYLWFCLVFVMMVVVGRAWCAMCPFGGFAEWLQRRTLWKRTQKALGLGKKLPEPIARYGFLLSVGSFLLLTWIEEFFNIAGPGAPHDTSFMVIGIVVSAVAFFLVFERRTFCRYFCPLTALIGSVGAMGSAAGFRTRDRNVCLECKTKDCMRGGKSGYGCPWYTWPGSADSNLSCGLCSECYKSCPSNNVGLFVQPPMTSIIAPKRRRADVAVGVLLLWGLVVFQQFNATNVYTPIDNWLNTNMHFPQYPNPVDFLGLIFAGALITGGAIWGIARIYGKKDLAEISSVPKKSILARNPRLLSFLLPITYGLIPIVGADYFARQLPKMFKHVSRLIPSVGAWFGSGSTHSSLYNTRLLSDPQIVIVQVGVIALGTFAAMWAMWRIANRELASV
ncbi:MAG TPA: 4Fe-4S binding protein, partial [Acidimicrobiales bacterium]|nr:4Fe-4S binding protein [Acidimicrobiales bacterium]